MDSHGQLQAYVYPQSLAPPFAVEGATEAIAMELNTHYKVIGYVTVKFIAFWDAYDNIPRLWAQDIKFGLTPIYGAFGTVAIAHMNDPKFTASLDGSETSQLMPLSLMPRIPDGKQPLI